jgi:hypothetical protein
VTVKAGSDETTASADTDDDQAAPTVKLSASCSQRATARRDCASAKAFKDARLATPETVPTRVSEKTSGKAETAMAKASATESISVIATPVVDVVAPAEKPAVQPRRAAATPKVKRSRPASNAPVERLVKVYDQVMPDGRRVPVYRRGGSGGYETGTVVGGEYRPARRANLEPPTGRYFGMQ